MTTIRTRVLPVVGACCGAAGLVAYAASSAEQTALRGVLAACLFVGALELVGRATGTRGRRAAVVRGAQVAWPAFLALGALPLAVRWPQALGGHLAAAIAVVVAVVLTFRVDRASPTRIPFVSTPLRPRIGVWEAALLAVAAGVTLLYAEIGSHAQGNFQNDSAYYFGVARHMAMTHRFEEPIVWHFVNPPPALVHAPFDYWGGLTSLVLAPILAVFGPTQHTAFVTMAVISGFTVIAFWYLLCFALPLRYAPLQLLGLLSFAFAHTARNYRFDTESLQLHHLLLIGLMICLLTARFRVAIVVAFLLPLCRPDGMFLFVATTVFVLVRLRREPRQAHRAATIAGALVVAYVARNLWSFHTLLPPGASAGALVEDLHEVYLFHHGPPSLRGAVTRLFSFSYVGHRIDRVVVEFFIQRRIVPAPELWYVLAALATLASRRRGRGAIDVLPAVALLAALAAALLSGAVFSEWRTLNALLPLLVVGLLASVSALFDGIVVATHRLRKYRLGWALAASALVLGVAYPITTRIEPYGHREPGALRPRELDLEKLDDLLAGAAVASPNPWWVLAHTRSPVVSIPEDGEASIAEVIQRYGVVWIVTISDAGALRRLLDPLAVGGRAAVDRLIVERVAAPGSVRAYRVVRD